MKLSLITVWLATAALALSAPKFAVVRVTDIFRGLPSTSAQQKSMQEQRNAIMQNTRVERFRTSLMEMAELERKLSSVKDNLDTPEAQKLVRDYEIKRQEAETLRQEFESFRTEENKRINREMVIATRKSLERITAAATQIAKERNMDGLFDSSGDSNTGVPLLLYSPHAVDITEDVIALLAQTTPTPSVGTDQAPPVTGGNP